MMIEKATVVSYQQGIATVQCYAKRGCGGCSSHTECGTSALSALAGERFAPQFDVKVSEILQKGDQIELGLTEQTLLFSVFWLYTVPLFVVISSSLFFSQWINNELLVALLIFLSTAIAFFIIRNILLRRAKKNIVPVFLRKI